MNKIINNNSVPKISSQYKNSDEKIVLVGGCFDVLHEGHLKFLESAKETADKLFILLESDENIVIRKGNNRPVNNQKNRAIVLSSLKTVDHIILLEGMTKNEEYDKLMVQISPDVVAITDGDKNISKRNEQCKRVGAKLVIIEKFDSPSTSELIENFQNG